VVIGIESDHGLLVEAMVGSGYRVLSDQPCDLGPGPGGRIAVEIEVRSR
jgi:hypothetical protein